MNINENVLWDHEDLVVCLIKNDIIHARLIYGHHQITLESNNNQLTLNKAILWHMGVWEIQTYQSLMDFYSKITVRVKKQKKNLDNSELDNFSREIFNRLKDEINSLPMKLRNGKAYSSE